MIWRRIALLCHDRDWPSWHLTILSEPLMLESRAVLHLAASDLDCLIPEFMPTPVAALSQ